MKNKRKILILGSGIAGLSSALKLIEYTNPKDTPYDLEITLVAKEALSEGSTQYAQGGIATVWNEKDSFEKHEQDTLKAGDGLCDPNVVSICVREGPERIRDLVEWGVKFTKENSNRNADYDLHREGGHQEHRILHKDDLTGAEIQRALTQALKTSHKVKVLEYTVAVDLIIDKKTNHCRGAYLLNTRSGQIASHSAHAVILATGGAGKVYLYTTNPSTATGDGIAMAGRAGARLANLEFMQFHPTCLFHPKERSFLITEALRGEGAILRNFKHEAFMDAEHPLKDLAPRDIVARAIDKEMKKTGAQHVWLDATHLGVQLLKSKFPNIYERLSQLGIAMEKDLIPIVPAAHYTCGGVMTDGHGQTTLPGLYAVGEVSSTGLHGANRLASNSLLEGVVFGARAAQHLTEELLSQSKSLPHLDSLPEWDIGKAVEIEDQIDIAATWFEIRWIMWNYVGIVRSNHRLRRAQRRLELIHNEVNQYYWKYRLTAELVELRNLIYVAQRIVESALIRKESRGLHTNVDYPTKDDRFFLKNTVL